ncbi:MAG: hypothetical protein IID15_02680 [Candidatus Marinimicrobia bacterium]|nr:hypothetical protein [Candidatus Neomarinimicrobiota bacterium]
MTHTRPMLAMVVTATGTALTFAEVILLGLRIGGAAVTLAIGAVTLYHMVRRR